ncbi:MAG: NADH:flavin oxidoreductase [Desulfarculaceae bacterium]|nr:NADH:flavin oxidoreductase [Desulfarculaceae bacterium]
MNATADPGPLGQPLALGGPVAPNRLLRSATMENMASPDGMAGEALALLYAELARGGVGTIITGATAVSRAGRAWAGQMGAWDDAQIPGLASVAEAIHAQGTGALCAVQLHHAGSAAAGYSYGSLEHGFDLNRIAEDEIRELAREFGRAAARVRAAGFDAAAVHGAHGYLVSQFFTPAINKRTDAWGGSRENRGRFPLLVLAEIRRAAGEDFPVFWKMNCDDFLPEGAGQEDYAWLAGELAQGGAGLIEISGGIKDQIKLRARLKRQVGEAEAYFLPALAAFRAAVGGVPLAITGGLRTRAAMEGVLASGSDLAGLCRPLVSEPDLPQRLLGDAGDAAARCIDCNQCLLAIAEKPLACFNFAD